jgi:hypothetical protein
MEITILSFIVAESITGFTGASTLLEDYSGDGLYN